MPKSRQTDNAAIYNRADRKRSAAAKRQSILRRQERRAKRAIHGR